MKQAYLGLGTNIEPREEYLSEAIAIIEASESIAVQNQSSIYQTAPVGFTEQADFLNMVLEVTTTYSALELLDICQKVEQTLGRKRTIRFGPRTIDVDVLWYDDKNIDTERLIVPHPRMHERAFVLVPLAEIAEDLHITGTGRNIRELIQTLAPQDLQGVVKWTD